MKLKTDFNMTLAEALEGRPARIDRVEAQAEERDRLEAIGLCPGRTVEVVKAGDPMIVRVLGTRIGLAAAVARAVYLQLGSAD